MATAVLRQSNRNSLRKWCFYFILFISFSQTVRKSISLLFSYSNFGISQRIFFFLSLKCKTAVSFHHFNNYIVVTIFKFSIRISFNSFPYTSLMVSVVENFKLKRNNKTESGKMVEFWSFSNFYNAFRFLNIVFHVFPRLILFLILYSVTVNLI